MDNLNLPKTSSTPAVAADWRTGVVSMIGDSYPENSFEQVDGHLHLDLKLVYLNTSSIRSMMDIFDQMEAAHQKGRAVSARWAFEPDNERVVQLAQEFREDCTFPFSIDSQPQ